jgi:hypothetical protein
MNTPNQLSNAATDMRNECAKIETELAAEREKSERYRLASLKLDVELVAMKARAEKAEAELAVSESERMEQARLLGKSGSREAALLTRLRADNLTAHQMACSAGLERDQLRAQLAAMKEASK